MREDKLKNVPSNKVGTVVQGFIDDGAQDVQAIKNGSGTWDVTAHFD